MHLYMGRPFKCFLEFTRFLCQPLYVSKRTIKHIRYTQYRGRLCRLCACVQSLLEEDFDKLKADQQTWKITGNSKRSKCSISSLTDCTTISWYGKSTWFNWYPLMPTKENINFTYKKVSYTQKKERESHIMGVSQCCLFLKQDRYCLCPMEKHSPSLILFFTWYQLDWGLKSFKNIHLWCMHVCVCVWLHEPSHAVACM